ncbi:MAG: nucleoside/nucleotide kinase family protein [Acidothermus cellulolyticus]|nr:nucleoside/nucleotide kinase family protein [Acidothermus cellulolyticus]
MADRRPLQVGAELGWLVNRARSLAARGSRAILGITGPPGAGKSTLAEHLCAALGDAALVPMDGFHLAERELRRLGIDRRKGAPQTFDSYGYRALLHRLRAATEPVVYAPEFRRDLEEPIAGAIPVPRGTQLVITEGNYLLLDDEPWCDIRELLDEIWYIDLDDAVRIRRLVERHIRFGRDRDAAEAWVEENDERNARLIAQTRDRADVVIVSR